MLSEPWFYSAVSGRKWNDLQLQGLVTLNLNYKTPLSDQIYDRQRLFTTIMEEL